ncbi:DUF3156 family protein [Vogesella sp. LIG4]|uniref:DUF3156 family protein n=1 Tax=Vogesella sp. LIG4 TaxID=1192162 RepID=UPI00081F9A8F|nr:DUF3156 family protein [Vogesella sp. LIG4]SCK16545.1 Protein of unknown function [Vogesella sp. LIG4]
MLHRLVDWLRRERPPRGYRPGATLARLRLELGAECEPAGSTALTCRSADGLAFSVCERTDAVFLAHTVSCEFRLPLALAVDTLAPEVGRIVIRHTGALRRQGIACQVTGADDGSLAAIAHRLQDDAALQAALLPLDFRRCELRLEDGRWQLCIEHFGASEVVSNFPPMRRYIRLIAPQRQALLQSLRACQQLLAA